MAESSSSTFAHGPELPAPVNLLEYLPQEWEALLRSWGQPRFRALQVFRWIHQRAETDPEAMTDLPKALRQRLQEEGLRPLLAVAADHLAGDGTRKLLVEMHDGRQVETVLIPRGSVAAEDIYAPQELDDGEPSGAGQQAQLTQCISSQVGCAMGCAFCASGRAGLKRQMSAGEIVSQVLLARRLMPSDVRHGGVVFMGMGEPLHNYGAVARALCLLSHPEGLGMSLRRITVSTSGLVPEMDRLAADFKGRVQLAVSIHAGDSATRSTIMPINRKYDLDQVVAAMRRYPLLARKRLTIEYTLLSGVNDAVKDARQLAALLKGMRAKVNLIPMNSVSDSGFGAPAAEAVDRFQAQLRAAGVDTFVRRRKGDDIAAACGQLALHGEARKIRLPVRQ